MKTGVKKILIILAVASISLGTAFLIVSRKQISVINIPTDKNEKQALKKEAASLEVASLIVPHHLVARQLIDSAFQEVVEKNKKQPSRIILISPNHFNLGRGWIIGSDEKWKTENGEVIGDEPVSKLLQAEKIINIEPGAFTREHGIRNIVPFIAQYFPQIPVVPLMIRDGMPEDLIIQTANTLADDISGNTLLILSSDFSHELDENISDFHDRKTIEALSSLNFEMMKNLETDCLSGMEIISRYSQLKGYDKFNLISNSNSSKTYNQHFIGDNTSYITGYYSKGEKNEITKTANILFFGDLMLDRDVRTLIEKKGAEFLTGKIKRLFWAQDLNVANLEGPITDNQSISVGTMEAEPAHFKFTFDPQMAEDVLKKLNINVVSLGNNHILNFESVGLSETKSNLDKFSVNYFGGGETSDYLIRDINGLRIAFVSYNAFSLKSAEKVVAQINEIKNKSDAVIVYTHWGKEYAISENENQRKLAHQFIDAGADLIIGSHPHVVQQIEEYNGKLIFYSLGNFIFDQYFSEDVKERLALGVSITDGKNMEFYLIPLYLEKNGELVLMDETRRKKFFGRLSNDSTINAADANNIKKMILQGRLEIKSKTCDNCNNEQKID